MSLEVCSKQIQGHGGDISMTKSGAAPANNLAGMTTNANKYGGQEVTSSDTNYTPNNVKPGSNGLAGS
jgi:hypothetical protein